MTDSERAAILKAEMIKIGNKFFEAGDYNLNIVGLRSASDHSNVFDDVMLVAYKLAGAWHVERWACTTDPGRAWLANPMRQAGCAILAPGQYRSAYELGLHKGKRALRQVGNLKIWRDNDKDGELDRNGPLLDADPSAGINIHRAGKDSQLVDLWSAGCQVFKREADYLLFLDLCDKQHAKGKGWDKFTYTLIDVGDHPALLDLMSAH